MTDVLLHRTTDCEAELATTELGKKKKPDSDLSQDFLQVIFKCNVDVYLQVACSLFSLFFR